MDTAEVFSHQISSSHHSFLTAAYKGFIRQMKVQVSWMNSTAMTALAKQINYVNNMMIFKVAVHLNTQKQCTKCTSE